MNPFPTKATGLREPELFTFENTNNLTDTSIGQPVIVSGEMTVSLAPNGSKFDGFVSNVDKKSVTVQIEGSFECVYSGNVPSYGRDTLVSDGNGAIKKDVGGDVFLILSIDTNAKRVSFIRL
ncbi:hypothetical protein LEP1GSC034_1011 [Leptospira interrogans str. 2003000735]|uniref:Uncharacterized protein n=2 Tax=Leptospira interrogans TaxID=173 RepID=A0A829DB44_LEPIR|nr:hypothetical protein [Leptospira interrogans]EMY06245.1 hypothetical protein LEP1GSC029_3148 [Leptospira interrogans str. 2002000626]EMY25552.1 hypothetical protein LEP1GSC115_1483 [Leptospira interrogans serovar Australis str. 200703203]EKN89899.1 hypothetical protein LEP1GSC027_3962 [Leptospira interrogans str. 2002000624]EKQ40316.1 hypothetical protein LEP1GSC025_2157 [Leptospira interrogans str. 2002000621]EMJ68694.1 hypothetical protein LEP1GSC034_0781 [Leptospira interrogans str. 2003